jgi:S-methylmethionine-dependent homocysteine/selenocysteine methylase
MSYSYVKNKLDSNGVVVLDGGIGGELEKIGAIMDKDLWCGKCSVDNPDKLLKVHENYINAGVDVITTNTYATTPISMKEYGYENLTNELNKKSVEIAKQAANNSDREIAIAGSVSTSGSWDKLELNQLKPGFSEHLKILSDAGVDLIILEAMTSKNSTVETIIECSLQINLPIWLSISCALDKDDKKLMHGYQENIDNSKAKFYDDFAKSIKQFSSMHKGPILVAHSDIKVTKSAVKTIKENHKGVIGAYPNNGYFEKPKWKLVENISPTDYLNEAKSWVSNGAQIIGGCCGVGPELIKAISNLK